MDKLLTHRSPYRAAATDDEETPREQPGRAVGGGARPVGVARGAARRSAGDPWSLGPDELDGTRRRGTTTQHPADVAAQEALPRGGTVLDVGCGTGASSAPLRRTASRITGVDAKVDMLEAFEERTAERPGLLRRIAGGTPQVRTVQGRWPEVADRVDAADVVLAHHVLYDVPHDVAGFVEALTEHARVAVIAVVTARHPLHWVNPYAEHLHAVRRPAEPTGELAADVVREVTGTAPTVLTWTEHVEEPEDEEAFLRLVARRVCARPEQHGDLRAVLRRVPPPTTQPMVGLVWPGTAA